MNHNHGQSTTDAGETVEQATTGAATPHECEFCSPEPEPIPAPGDGTGDEGGPLLGTPSTSSAVSETEAIGELWLE
jgi:hypothetical protein